MDSSSGTWSPKMACSCFGSSREDANVMATLCVRVYYVIQTRKHVHHAHLLRTWWVLPRCSGPSQ